MQNKKVLAVLEDLFFTVKINESAKRAGLPAQFVKSEKDALDKAAEQPAVIILDLNFAGILNSRRRKPGATWCWPGRRFRRTYL